MRLKVTTYLAIAEGDLDPTTREGRALASFAGAFFTVGDVITVSPQQGAALLASYPDHFATVEEQ